MSILYRNHEVYPESILIRDFTNKVSVDEIIRSWEYLIENNMINPSIKGVINNIAGCELEMTIDSFEILIDYLKMKKIFNNIKLAVICDNPKTIIFPILGAIDVKELKIKPFSTFASAENWILNE